MESEGTVTFCQSDLPSTSFCIFQRMRLRDEFCDIKINVHNRSITAHRVVLAAGIPYFYSVLTSSENESESEKEITFGDIDPRAMESLIDFVYSTEIKISVENAHSLLTTSCILQLTKVQDACVDFISKRLRISNVVQVRLFAETIKNPNLIKRSNNYIRRSFEAISKSEDFSSLPYSCVKEVIAEDDLSASSEEIVFDAVLKWVRKSPEERYSLLPPLLSEVRLVYLSTDYLNDHMTSDELIKESTPCIDLLNEVKSYHSRKKEFLFSCVRSHPQKLNYVKQSIYAAAFNGTSELSVHCYDFVNEMWHDLAFTKQQKTHVHHIAARNAKIYIFLQEKILTFHVKTQEWKTLEPRHEHLDGAAIVPHGSVVYCFGSSDDNSFNKVRCFNMLQTAWLNETRMKYGRCHAAAASLEESIYVTGGQSSRFWGGNRLDTVEKYNPSTGRWCEVAPMLNSRKNHSCASMNEKIYVCGDVNKPVFDISDTAEMYDPLIDEWSLISSMAIGRHLFSLVPHKGKIYAVGGETRAVEPKTHEQNVSVVRKGPSLYEIETVEIYCPESDQWTCGFRVPFTGHTFVGAVSIFTSRN